MKKAPAVLLPYQAKWQRDKSRVRIAEKSRRIGFSWNSACEVTLQAASIDGCDAWYVGYNKDMALEFIRDCAWWAKHFDVVAADVEESIFEDADPDKGILMYTIRFVTGFRICALSSRPTNLRGKRGHIIIDEAAFHDDLKGLMKSAMAVLMWGGKNRVDIISTHNGVDSYYNKIIEEVRAKKRPYSVHRVTLQDALDEGLFRRVCLMNGVVWSQKREDDWREELYDYYGEDAEEELDCVPAKSGRVYIARYMVERAMVQRPVFRVECDDDFVTFSETARKSLTNEWCEDNLKFALNSLPKDKLHFFGQDFGRVSDRSVIVPGYLDQDLTRQYPFVVEMLNVPFKQQEQILFYIVDKLPRLLAGHMDATGNGASLAEAALQRYGKNKITCVNMSEKWYHENLPPLKAAYEEGLIQHPRDADHLIDMTSFKVINGVPKLPKAKTKTADGKGPKRHGDAGIAYALGYSASCAPVQAYDYKQGSKRKNTETRERAGFKARSGGIW